METSEKVSGMLIILVWLIGMADMIGSWGIANLIAVWCVGMWNSISL